MKKIVVNFNSAHKIQKIKTIMKKVHSKGDEQTKDMVKFTLGKFLVPSMVERAEIHLADKHGIGETIHIPKESLTFLLGNKPPFQVIDRTSDNSNEYILLPWNIKTPEGNADLANLTSKISSKTKTFTYTIYVNIASSASSSSNSNLSTYAPNLSTMSFGGQIDELLEQIEELEQSLINSEATVAQTRLLVTQKDDLIRNLENDVTRLNNEQVQERNKINNLDNQIRTLNAQITSLNNQLSGKTTEINNIKSTISQKDSSISNLNYQINNLSKTPRINVNAGPLGMSGSRTSGSLGIDNVQVSFDFNNRTLNVVKHGSATITHQTII